MTTQPAVPDDDYCPCCTSGNHTERCTCDGLGCCHPETHRRPTAPAAPEGDDHA